MQYFWTRERMHFPDVVTPLDAAMMGDIHNLSFNVPLAALGMPIRMHFMTVNSYVYTAMAPPPGPLPDNALTRAMGKFWRAPPRSEEQNDVLHGGSGSPGITRGPVRIVRSLHEAGKLQVGDVLVAETTAPSWTPLFSTAAAVVTDTGGVLSHCAIVAREYRIPAVFGVGNATTTLRDGQFVEVDGDAGLVRILAGS